MIISHKHRFIFIKTRKTAGTSIEISLSRYCGRDDIITPITLLDEPLRGVLGLSAQNYLCPSDGSDRSILDRPVRRALLRASSRVELSRPETMPHRFRSSLSNHRSPRVLENRGHYYNHIPSNEVIKRLGSGTWSSYYRFCFDRDPLTKVVSDYLYRAPGRSFDEYVNGYPLPIDYAKYYVDGVRSVDFVGRFEALTDDLTRALKVVGIAFDGWLPRAKARARKGNGFVLTPAQGRMIETRFRAEYETVTVARPSPPPDHP